MEAFLIDQVGRLAVGVDEDMIGGAALGREDGLDIGVGDIPVAGGIKTESSGLAVRCLDDDRAGHMPRRITQKPRNRESRFE